MELRLDRPLIFFDLETTGLSDPVRIVQIAAVKLNPDGTTEERVKLVNPQRPIEPDAVALHGITDELAAREKPFAAYAKSIAQFFTGCDLCGFNTRKYDLRILMEEFRRAGAVPDLQSSRHVDVMAIYHHFFPRDLQAAYREYCGGEIDRAHNALSDAKATIAILRAQIERHQLPADIGGLSSFVDRAMPARNQQRTGGRLRKENGELTLAFGKHSGRTLKWLAANERNYLEWILGADFDEEFKGEVRKALAVTGT